MINSLTAKEEQIVKLAKSMSRGCEGKSACMVGDATLLIVQNVIIQLHGDEAEE
jgi:hypothetical protein